MISKKPMYIYPCPGDESRNGGMSVEVSMEDA